MNDLIATKGNPRRRASFISTIKEFLPSTGKFEVNFELFYLIIYIENVANFQHFYIVSNLSSFFILKRFPNRISALCYCNN